MLHTAIVTNKKRPKGKKSAKKVLKKIGFIYDRAIGDDEREVAGTLVELSRVVRDVYYWEMHSETVKELDAYQRVREHANSMIGDIAGFIRKQIASRFNTEIGQKVVQYLVEEAISSNDKVLAIVERAEKLLPIGRKRVKNVRKK